jgi:hypothetical protein
MKKKDEDATALQPTQDDAREMAKVIPIRIETAINQFPFYQLSKGKDPIQIGITTYGARGKVSTQWRVSPNAEYGHPGSLAYKLDTLVINRLIDEMRPNVPDVLRLGSLSEIARELGLGNDTSLVKKALHQNASAYITANLLFQGNDGTEREFKFGATRYEVIFYGEKLPDGRKADAVYVVFHRSYYEMLSHARTRPLDYAYLRALPPSAQRLYELIAPQIFAALKNDNPRAKYLYSELCQRAPITRYYEWEKVKKQLYKIHRPHIQSGYIKAVDFEPARDAEGRMDWEMWYTPGRKARAEYRRFNTKEGKELDKQPRVSPRMVTIELLPPADYELLGITEDELAEAAGEELIRRLVDEGVSENVARELVRADEAECARQLEALPARDRVKDRGAYLVRAIRDRYAMPPKIEQKRRQQAAAEQKQREEETTQRLRNEYNEFLRGELAALKKRNRKAFDAFREDFKSFWQTLQPNLGDGARAVIELHHFETFARENPRLGIPVFEQWRTD